MTARSEEKEIAMSPTILPDSPEILYTGRFDFTDSVNPLMGWTGSSLIINFDGTSFAADFTATSGNEYLFVIVDGGEPANHRLSKGRDHYVLAENLKEGNHRIEIIKKTEPWEGHITFHGIYLDEGKSLLAAPERPRLKLEFYGDSNTSAYSSESISDLSTSIYTNSYYSYAAQTARALDAEYHNMGWGGLGVVATGTKLQSIWNRTLPRSRSEWDFTRYAPDCIVINVGANDSYGEDLSVEIMAAWESFVKDDLRSVYPETPIVFANSYGWSFNEPTNYLPMFIERLKNEGVENISYVKFPWLWGQTHAVAEEHAGFANILIPHIASLLGIEAPAPLELSSFAGPGKVSNGDLEIAGLGHKRDVDAAGWRKWNKGGIALVKSDGEIAHSGSRYAEITTRSNGKAGFWQTTAPLDGASYMASAFIKAVEGDKATLKIVFKDQAQNIIGTSEEDDFTVTGEWEQYSVTAGEAPEQAWSVSVYMEVNEGAQTILFDDIELVAVTGE